MSHLYLTRDIGREKRGKATIREAHYLNITGIIETNIKGGMGIHSQRDDVEGLSSKGIGVTIRKLQMGIQLEHLCD